MHEVTQKPLKQTTDELKTVSDTALQERSLGLAAIIQSQAEALHQINTELTRRYKNKKKECEELAEYKKGYETTMSNSQTS